ncbi:hypothetical protein ACFQ9X_48715 [Catenulispora yoronensis]
MGGAEVFEVPGVVVAGDGWAGDEVASCGVADSLFRPSRPSSPFMFMVTATPTTAMVVPSAALAWSLRLRRSPRRFIAEAGPA